MIISCVECKKEFNRAPADAKRNVNNFCSRSCAASYNNRIYPKRKQENKEKRLCLICSNPVERSRKYCSNKCLDRSKTINFVAKKNEIKKTNPQAVVEWRQRTKIKLVAYKGGSCEICGYNKCLTALQFHHKDPSKKDFTISGSSKAYETLRLEVDKCILVCSNCHAEIHAGINQFTELATLQQI